MFTVQRFLGKVLRLLVNRGLLSPEWGERILSWRHSGFNAHSRVRARTKIEAGRVGKYMVRPVLGLDRLVFLEREGQVGYTEYAVVDWTIRHLKLEFLTPFCSREYHHFVRGGAYFGPHGSEFSDAQKRNFLSLFGAAPDRNLFVRDKIGKDKRPKLLPAYPFANYGWFRRPARKRPYEQLR